MSLCLSVCLSIIYICICFIKQFLRSSWPTSASATPSTPFLLLLLSIANHWRLAITVIMTSLLHILFLATNCSLPLSLSLSVCLSRSTHPYTFSSSLALCWRSVDAQSRPISLSRWHCITAAAIAVVAVVVVVDLVLVRLYYWLSAPSPLRKGNAKCPSHGLCLCLCFCFCFCPVTDGPPWSTTVID